MSKILKQLLQEAYEKQAKLEGDLDKCDSLVFGEHVFDLVIEAFKEWLMQKRQIKDITKWTEDNWIIQENVSQIKFIDELLEELNQQ